MFFFRLVQSSVGGRVCAGDRGVTPGMIIAAAEMVLGSYMLEGEVVMAGKLPVQSRGCCSVARSCRAPLSAYLWCIGNVMIRLPLANCKSDREFDHISS